KMACMATMVIPLDREGSVPLGRQIQEHFERLIREGRLAPGVKLPATRELARTLGVNRSTVAVAYDDLVAAGWAHAHVGQATFVAEPTGSPMAGGPTRPATPLGRAASRPPVDWAGLFSRSARLIGRGSPRTAPPGASVKGLVSFAGGMPDENLFPTDA